MSTLHHCTSCHADIAWTVTATGERMPIDPYPVAGGDVRLVDEGGTTRALVVGCTIDLFDPADDGTRYVSHFATCPNADEHRRTA